MRSRDVPVSPVKNRKEVQPKNDSSSTQKKGKEPSDPTSSQGPYTNEKTNQLSAAKEKIEKKDSSVKEVDKVSTFSL